MERQNPEFDILADFKIIVSENREFKIFCKFNILERKYPEFNKLANFKIFDSQNPEFKILVSQNPEFGNLGKFKFWKSKTLNLRCWLVYIFWRAKLRIQHFC